MPGPFAPDSTLLSNIIHQIAVTIKEQIPTISYIYEDAPDRAPGDNSVLLPLTKFKVLDDTNGKLKVNFTISARHVFRRKQMSDNLKQAYSYIYPWMMVLSAWSNQTLGGYAMEVNPKEGGVSQVSEAGQSMVALVNTFEVVTEFNIPLS